MVATSRKQDHSLATTLTEEPYQFSFFQAVRLLERLFPKSSPIGQDGDPKQETVRLKGQVSLCFPPSEIYDLELPAVEKAENTEHTEENSDHSLPEMIVAFMGLAGPVGTLPACYTEELVRRARENDPGFAEFLNLFNHRLISFFYRAWEKYRFPVGFERNGQDPFTEYMYHVVGTGPKPLREETIIPDRALIYYSGLISQSPHSAVAIEAILSDYFGIQVEVEQFVGRWLNLETDDLSRLGTNANQLGFDLISGSKVWDQQSKFRLQLGPLAFKEFSSFLPTGEAYQPLLEFTKFLAGMEFDFDVQLILQAPEVPDFVLDSRSDNIRLGWTTWLKSKDFEHDDRQVILSANI